MRFFAISIMLFFASAVVAQGTEVPGMVKPTEDSLELELQLGDTMEVGACPSPAFKHMDYFKKTRWEGEPIPYDTATGNGFYKSFFTSGDFDIYELPASFSGKKFVIMGMEVLTDKNTGKDIAILYLRGPEPHSVIWVDFEPAIDNKELLVAVPQ
jgi:hypothetical protein